ncbi:hypothetical protein RND81_06G126300 [Saponaria officinalis]|uniref:Retrotransposon gag domain-containing protein n=1 Tax=Saponaria officinalis TaxID=3572 RepID=A0AAW1KAH5_SAPOF
MREFATIIAEALGNRDLNNEEDSVKYFKKMASYNPKTYDGKPDPVEFENWIRGMDKIFDAIKCPEKWKIGFAIGFGLSQFKEAMRSKFYPLSLRRQKEEEFNKLEQESMSVMTYAGKFMELSRFAPHLVATEELRMNRFERGLNWSLRDRLSTHTCLNYQEMYDKATNAERMMKEINEEQMMHKRKFEGERGTERNFFKPPNLGGGKNFTNQTRGRYQGPRCGKCGLTNHAMEQCRYVWIPGLR